MRRVVTGHTADGTAVIVSDEELTPMAIGDRGDTIARVLSVTVGAHNRLEGGRAV